MVVLENDKYTRHKQARAFSVQGIRKGSIRATLVHLE